MVLRWLRWVIEHEEGHELLFVGDDWAEAHHDVELMDAAGGGWPRPGCLRGWWGWPGCTR